MDGHRRDPRPERDDPAASSADEESLFDDYSERALRGNAPPPDEFLASHPTASAELREALNRMFLRGPRGAVAGDELPFERLGEFRLLRRLGGGGMGIVFLAVQESLGREVALKIQRPELTGSAVAAERFRREARALAQLRHENLVTIFGGGEERGVRWLAMELVGGTSLDELLRRDDFAAIPVARRLRWIAGLARGLQHAHEQGIVHRDVKPSNVRITPEDRAKLLDFGLARQDGSLGVTLTESFAGSPSWAAPEQIQERGQIDARTDVYALGVTLYQCLTGRMPYEGATVEQLFHRILTATPVPPRKLVPSLPRDLEVVALKAFERRPEQRYASAAALADDLEAVLELRPIAARPPTMPQRARRLLRSHPLLSTAVATGLLAAITLGSVFAMERRSREQATRLEAARLVTVAHDRLGDYRARRASLSEVQKRVNELLRQIESEHFTDDDYALIDRYQAQLENERRAWEQTYYEVLDLLRQAERIDPNVAGGDDIRGELYLARYHEALDLAEPFEAEFFRDLAAKSDPRLARELSGEAPMTIASDPPGADVWLFRLQEQSRLRPDGEPRMVAVPDQADQSSPPVAPGTWVLRVLRDAPPLLRGDLVFEVEGAPIEGSVFVIEGGQHVGAGARLVSVDGKRVRDDWDAEQLGPPTTQPRRFEFVEGGVTTALEACSLAELGIEVGAAGRFAAAAQRDAVRCRLVRDGQPLDSLLPPAAPARTTARPLVTSPACRIGTTPLTHRVPVGEYLLVLRKEGREEIRYGASIRGESNVDFRMPPLGSAPDGFVFIANEAGATNPGFWMMEREVTSAEWREFLRDPEIRQRIGSGWKRYVPRHSGQPGPYWIQAADGTWTWPPVWTGEWPIVGISWNDAHDYVEWRNRRQPASGGEFALPSFEEHSWAVMGRLSWPFVYGLRLRPRWSRCCFAREHANSGPVMEFPIDESPAGIFDCTGSAFEWLDHWYDEPRNMRMLAGGAWGQAKWDTLNAAGGMGVAPDVATGETGLRLVLRPRPAGAEPPR